MTDPSRDSAKYAEEVLAATRRVFSKSDENLRTSIRKGVERIELDGSPFPDSAIEIHWADDSSASQADRFRLWGGGFNSPTDEHWMNPDILASMILGNFMEP
jgi:hypothetical protein